MNLLAALLDVKLVAAAALYAAGTATALLGLERLRRHAEIAALSGWLLHHLGRPLVHGLLLLTYVLIAYPSVFGLSHAPGLTIVLGMQARWEGLINLTALLALALPWIARPAGLQALLLPIQTAALLALLAHWLAAAQGLHRIHYLPSPIETALFVALSWVGYRLNRAFGQRVGAVIDRHWALAGSGLIVGEALLPLFQAPGIVVYALTLGRQLAA